MDDEAESAKQQPALRNLDEMSIKALHGYLDELEAEMARVRKVIAAKEQARIGANALFKKIL